MSQKKDFLSSLAQEVEDTKKGREPKKKMMSVDDYVANNKAKMDTNSILEDYEMPKARKVDSPKVEEVKPQESYFDSSISEDEGYNYDDQPRSFQEEELKKVEKKPLKIDPKVAIAGAVIVVLLVVVSYFMFFAPKITLPDFAGKPLSELTAWLKQNGIQSSAVVISEEYSLDVEKDYIISQQQAPGKKIHEDTPLNFVKSKGANPEDSVDFPDIMNMDYDSIKSWIDENQLSKTKINTVYNETVEENKVISYDLKNVAENNFTRGTSLVINISRGKAPAGQVTLEDFTGKTYEEVASWAKTKKINLVKEEAYSDTIELGKIISQSVKSGTTMKEGEELILVVSKGKAVKIIDLVGYDKTMLEAWQSDKDNAVTIVKREVFSEQAEGTVISQSIPAGSQVDQGTVLELGISLYMPILETNSQEWYGKDYLELIAKVDEWNGKGANIAVGTWDGEEKSDTYKTPGQIIEYRCLDSAGNQLNADHNGCARPLPLNAKISMKISSGPTQVVCPVGAQCDESGNIMNCEPGYKFENGTCVVIPCECPEGAVCDANCKVEGCKAGYTLVGDKCEKLPDSNNQG